MVLGHEKCGAVKATVEAVENNVTAEAEINWLVDGIRPAVEAAPVDQMKPMTVMTKSTSSVFSTMPERRRSSKRASRSAPASCTISSPSM